MIIANQRVSYQQVFMDRWEAVEGETIVEAPVGLTVNGKTWLTFMCTPIEQEALALGFLYTEGVIQSIEEVEHYRVCPAGDNVDVWLSHEAEKPAHWIHTSGCTGGMTSQRLDQLVPVDVDRYDESASKDELRLNAEQIGHLIARLLESQDIYRTAGGVHASALCEGEQVCVVAEDIGRHNTLDKIAGRCLIDTIPMAGKVLLTTGRVSSEMIQKSARIGAPVVISRTSPSTLSIEMAQRWGITLIGYARRDRFRIFSHPERIWLEGYPPDPL